MTRNQIQQELLVLLKPFTRSISTDFVVTESASLSSDLNINSVDLVDMVLEIEERFDVQVPDSAIQEFETVGQVVDFLQGAAPSQSAPEPVSSLLG